jgi:voltage-gated potassium channel
MPPDTRSPDAAWRVRLHEIIFEADTFAGKAFDVALLAAILLSVTAVVLESVEAIGQRLGPTLRTVEWAFTVLFTVEYVLRLVCVRRPWRYATSFLGVVDLLAVIPTYLSLLYGGAQALIVIRALRLLRVFRIFKLARYLGELTALLAAIRASRAKIIVFLLTVLTVVLIMGTAIYVVEGESSGFTSIPRAVYWAVVTVTTVGYGDIAPRTVFGQAIAAVAMILGYSLIIIPTGIFSMELIEASKRSVTTQVCPSCTAEGHDSDARFCKYCGARL